MAHRRRIGPWMRAASVIVDMALLTVTIWSFHLEYDQPAAFYLKAPTFTYFFIFVALRALSFSPGHVLLAGGAAALGWLVLLGYALAEPGAIDLVTRNYVEYMTSAKILIGGEIDKVISLLLVSALLAIAAGRARQLLERAVAEQAASSQLARFFSPEVAERGLARPGRGHRHRGGRGDLRRHRRGRPPRVRGDRRPGQPRREAAEPHQGGRGARPRFAVRPRPRSPAGLCAVPDARAAPGA